VWQPSVYNFRKVFYQKLLAENVRTEGFVCQKKGSRKGKKNGICLKYRYKGNIVYIIERIGDRNRLTELLYVTKERQQDERVSTWGRLTNRKTGWKIARESELWLH
jgi:hypothetical protein